MKSTLFSAALLASGLAVAATPVNGFYSSVFGGYTYLPSNVNEWNYAIFFDGDEYNNGYNAGGRFGYQSNPLRYEVEYTYLTANLKKYSANFIQQTDPSGFSTANLLMANVYYDTPEMLPSIVPFLGFGIGYSFIETSLSSTGPTIGTYFHAQDSAFAYQGTVGLTYNFAENYAVNLAYRYVSTAKAGEFGSVYQANLASAGAIYRFDQGNYK